ncbi:tlde1 domain-containing protein [Pantoea sp. FN060301]|uniref:tlde1 domain-containing protein n=1 Tax=Pantoea sp. FN060301 TaxID=3420380 RepID=UPI003D173564
MTWIYNVNKNAFYHNEKFEFYASYAGAPGYKNDSKYECIKDKGPLPRGKYRIVGAPFTHPKAGPFTLRLEPLPGNNMCGRAGFLIHGDSKRDPGTASNGCIILNRDLRKVIWDSLDKEVIIQ